MLKSEEQRDRPDNHREFQRADIDAPGRRCGQQIVVVVQQERRIDADAVIVEEADDQEKPCRQHEQHQQDQRHAVRPVTRTQSTTASGTVVPRERGAGRGLPAASDCRLAPRALRKASGCSMSVAAPSSIRAYAAAMISFLQRISGRIRVPNCSMPMTKSSNVSITPLHARHRGQLIQHARHRGIRPHQHALVRRQLIHAKRPPLVGLRIRILVRIVLRLLVAIRQRLDIGSGDIVFPLRHRRRVGFIGDDHLQHQRAARAARSPASRPPAGRRSVPHASAR